LASLASDGLVHANTICGLVAHAANSMTGNYIG
jgi:hypothetical protein